MLLFRVSSLSRFVIWWHISCTHSLTNTETRTRPPPPTPPRCNHTHVVLRPSANLSRVPVRTRNWPTCPWTQRHWNNLALKRRMCIALKRFVLHLLRTILPSAKLRILSRWSCCAYERRSSGGHTSAIRNTWSALNLVSSSENHLKETATLHLVKTRCWRISNSPSPWLNATLWEFAEASRQLTGWSEQIVVGEIDTVLVCRWTPQLRVRYYVEKKRTCYRSSGSNGQRSSAISLKICRWC